MFERADAGTFPAALIVRARRERRRVADTTTADDYAEDRGSVFAQALPISLNDWPFFHRSQSSAFPPAKGPGRPICSYTPPDWYLDQVVLRRSIEPTALFFAWQRLHITGRQKVPPLQLIGRDTALRSSRRSKDNSCLT